MCLVGIIKMSLQGYKFTSSCKKEGTNKRSLQKQIHLMSMKKKIVIIWKLNVDLQMERPIRSFIPSLCQDRNIS